MARTIKEREHAAKRNDILTAAQQLVYTKGYEQMTIQDLLDDLGISSGAFYHYFDSKRVLLEALVQRMLDEALQLLVPLVRDSNLPAVEKLQGFFATFFQWRMQRKDVLLALLRVWYTDDNALVRQKVRAAMRTRFTALLGEVIQQGVQEGVLTTPYPEQVASVIVHLRMGLSESLGELLLAFASRPDDLAQLAQIEGTIAVYTDAIERILGIPRGNLTIADPAILKAWMV